MDGQTDGSILICHPKFLRGHNKNKNSGGWEGRGWGGARVSDFFFQKNPSLKFFFFLRG